VTEFEIGWEGFEVDFEVDELFEAHLANNLVFEGSHEGVDLRVVGKRTVLHRDTADSYLGYELEAVAGIEAADALGAAADAEECEHASDSETDEAEDEADLEDSADPPEEAAASLGLAGAADSGRSLGRRWWLVRRSDARVVRCGGPDAAIGLGHRCGPCARVGDRAVRRVRWQR